MEAYTMTRKEELVAAYWDFYKELYNVRPRWVNFESCSEADLEEMLAELSRQSVAVWEQREADEQNAKVRIEMLIDVTIACGAGTREDAIRWLIDASGCANDYEMFCWDNGLPYTYFRKVA
jgi:hypothetical protein